MFSSVNPGEDKAPGHHSQTLVSSPTVEEVSLLSEVSLIREENTAYGKDWTAKGHVVSNSYGASRR